MFIGRYRELSRLNELWEKTTPSFVVCKGKRRIGKSTLIQKFAESADVFLEFQGAAPEKEMNNQKQIGIFAEQLCAQTKSPPFHPENWQQTFSFLATSLQKEQKTVLFLDEISWMARHEPNFSTLLKIAWDTHLKKFPKLILVICGSISSWIEENVLNYTVLMGRVSLEFTLKELPLHDCNQFWGEKRNRVSSMEKLKTLAVTGGIPRYLEEINPGLSAEENLKRMCFSKEGILFQEFGRIFHDVFDRRAEIYKEIVKTLVSRSQSARDISTALNRDNYYQHLNKYLEDLVQSDLLARDQIYSTTTTSKSLGATLYRLKDNYLRFYLKYIESNRNQIEEGFFSSIHLESLANWDSSMGLQFENLVLNHLDALLSVLSINPAAVLNASPYFQNKTTKQQACQVDLLIRTRYSVYVCEIKFRNDIDATLIEECWQKFQKLSFPKRISIRPVLIYAGNLSPRVTEQDFFDRIVSFADLLERPDSTK